MPPESSRGGRRKRCSNFLRHKIYKNSLISVVAEIGMEGQIMCVEQCTFQMSSVAFLGPQNAPKSLESELRRRPHWRNLQRSPRPTDGFKGPTSKAPTFKGKKRRGEEERNGEGGAPK